MRTENICRACGTEGTLSEELCEAGPHYSKIKCLSCGAFCGWGKIPKNDGKRQSNKHSPKDLGVDFCQMCLRDKNRLGTRGVLHSHHVHEIQDGGPDVPQNIWVLCTSCHSIVHHQRVYINDHFKNTFSINQLREDFEKNKIPKETRDILERIFKLQGEHDA